MHKLALISVLCLAPALSQAFSLPPFEQVKASHVSSDALLLDRSGEPLADLRIDHKVRQLDWTPLTALSPAMREALLAAEDRRFYTHNGIDWLAFAGAAWQNIWGSGKRGASTLTMQLAGLLDPTLRLPSGRGERRSLAQKWDQSRAAVELEERWTKAQILEAYLNLAPFRGDLSGIGAASELLFGLHPNALTPREASLLAALLRGPNAKPGVVAKRACRLLATLRSNVSCTEVTRLATRSLDAPRNQPRYRLAPHLSKQLLSRAGQRVTTTLDAGLQARLQAELGKTAAADTSVLVLDNASAEVLAWIGGRDVTLPDGVLQPRNLPDAILPFAAATALDQRLLNAASPLSLTAVFDARDAVAPVSGWMSLRTALREHQSVALQDMQNQSDRETLQDRLRRIGLPASGRTPQSATQSVNLLQLAAAWRSLASNGQWAQPNWLPGPAANAPAPRRVWRAETGFIVQDMLSSSTAGIWNTRWSSHATDQDSIVIVGASPRLTLVLASSQRNPDALWNRLLPALGDDPRPPAPPDTAVSSLVRFEPPDEPARREWFLPGTAVELVTALPDGRRGSVTSPLDGETITLPAGDTEREHLILRSAGSVAMRWWINGQLAGQGDHVAWLARPGQYLLSLTDPEDRLLQRLRFTVRNAAPAPTAPPPDSIHDSTQLAPSLRP